jgi:hypothetical protein
LVWFGEIERKLARGLFYHLWYGGRQQLFISSSMYSKEDAGV